jgi:hypothetical protein
MARFAPCEEKEFPKATENQCEFCYQEFGTALGQVSRSTIKGVCQECMDDLAQSFDGDRE